MSLEGNTSVTMNAIHDLYNVMNDKNIIMIYEGEFNQEITKTVLSMTENSFEDIGIETMIRKKIFNVMVEVLQNICKHQYNGHSDEPSALFMVGDSESEFIIVSGNVIEDANIEVVKSKIDKVNSMSKADLKEFYKVARLQSTISDVGGAGLGFIDIARKTGEMIEYEFTRVSKGYSFFSQLARISKKDIND